MRQRSVICSDIFIQKFTVCETNLDYRIAFVNVFVVAMNWYQDFEDEDEEDLMFSPALLARRASESWIVAPPNEV